MRRSISEVFGTLRKVIFNGTCTSSPPFSFLEDSQQKNLGDSEVTWSFGFGEKPAGLPEPRQEKMLSPRLEFPRQSPFGKALHDSSLDLPV